MVRVNPVTYTVVQTTVGDIGGTYKSSNGPAAAAKKAGRARFTRGVNKIRLTLRQKGTTDKFFTYDVTRVKLSKPMVRVINGEEVVYEYVIKTKAV